ncbi:acetyl-CoA sensor PanZ family protein [Pseudomonas panipatensis]|jgi:GNAT superfamily N-acetyltransferase|uniref:Acetyltransferase (GNAT) domain-containing protein n=1 Tax=Pseudomonas panipatensis TaxID=428992 RepID=A0A1G8K397_9PSED|nr:acetyl-CoA sensor PanZ family protein [Pseudomonas panipatensis]SDI37859.1 Acetyltransferase (GNAT) domain-containing protein [Pseudomonas panipatensis]SMP61031.1 Acetyltransferase (GNAT) domain-containing protein [Pseudomonas panipatensis]
MPVIVESLAQATAQDRQDLLKIYADAPTWLLAPFTDVEALVEAGLNAGTLLAGRFNDRLLGAAWVERKADGWQLSRLCVRKLTRGRGVGQRLLDEAQRMAVMAGQPLRLAIPADQPEVRQRAERAGLSLDEHC